MAITYPLTLPTVTGVATISLTARNIVGLSQSPFTLKTQVQKHAGQRWEANVTLPPMSRDEAEYWISFLMKLNGVFGTFLLGDPNATTPRGGIKDYPSDAMEVNGASQSGNSLNIDQATASITGYLKAGDYIQIGTGSTSQLYKVLSDADSNGSGEVTVDIWPNLRTAPADNDRVYAANTVGVFRLADNSAIFNIDQASTYGLTFSAIEAL
jgi:hypothetical protein